ncbi:proline and serine-rich protein 3 [Elgaria multicarinata webbii]|uniref:proline and serine-rich protein 3 n=1 Tax=Elgaria multicarinata webbii TaxID=159646 RepID=UPI002FCCB980
MDPKYDHCQAVFSTLGSPFLETSSCRSHYHPSQAQLLRQEQQNTVLSPSRFQRRNCSHSAKQAETLIPPQQTSLPDSSYQDVKPPKSDSTSPFNESWPSTERSSSSVTPEAAKGLPSEQASGTKALASPRTLDSVSDSESIIARYIERFRYGEPTTRGERWIPSGHSAQFWWLGHSFSPEGNISKKESSPSSDSSQSEVRPSLLSPVLDQFLSGDSQDTSTLDPETLNLQERAARLLHRSTSPLSSSRCVSLEGLNSTPTSTITNANADMSGCVSQHLAAHQHKGSVSALPCHITQMSQLYSSKPEDDILFQWRLRRKMEEASKAVTVMAPGAWRSHGIQPTCASSMVESAALKSPEPACWRTKGRRVLPTSESQLDMKSTVVEHHPCCCTDAMRNGPSSKQPVETAPYSNGIMVVGSPKSNREQEVRELAPQKDPVPAFLDSPSPPRPAGASKHSGQRTSCHVQRAAQPDERTHVEPRGNQRPIRSKQVQAKPVRDSEEPPKSPPKHSVRRVLGEVVSERLFSPPESPVLHRDKSKRSSKNWGSEEVLPDTVAAPSHPQLLNMAAQLLEQAEDSDGAEFEDDPLLQVLRGQRELLHSQLRAVDLRMAQLEDYHSDQDFSC